jgi:hypothetical protein
MDFGKRGMKQGGGKEWKNEAGDFGMRTRISIDCDQRNKKGRNPSGGCARSQKSFDNSSPAEG